MHGNAKEPFPRVRLSGTARERGRQLGEEARDRVHTTVEMYTSVFSALYGLDWRDVRKSAEAYLPSIRALSPAYIEELEGIAEGSELPFADILAVNARTEIKLPQIVRRFPNATVGMRGECTAVAAAPVATLDGHTLIGQNWDWCLRSLESVLLVEVDQPEGPRYVTMVEAGLLAKMGMNSRGIGLATNMLVCDTDDGRAGIPYHVMLRSLLDSTSIGDARARMEAVTRAASANYLLASADGSILDAEGAPGDSANLYLDDGGPSGVLTHTNHFVSPHFHHCDVGRWSDPSSMLRLERVRSRILERMPGLTPSDLQAAFTDHSGDLSTSVCTHADNTLSESAQEMTVCSAVMDLNERRMWVAAGPPCLHDFADMGVGEFLRGGN
jgi:isopenicillin-N N-acyltransferase like protein